MTCREVAGLSSDYLDRDLSFPRRLSFRFHLLLCSNCRRFVNGVRSLLRQSQLLRIRQRERHERLSSSLTERRDSADED